MGVFIERSFPALSPEKKEKQLPDHPSTIFIYQVNAEPFRRMIIEQYGLPEETRLTQLPQEVWEELKITTHADYLYLFGTNPESAYAKQIAQHYGESHLSQMKGLTRDNLRGSPYALPTQDTFHPAIALDNTEFIQFKNRLEKIGMKVMLDEVLNHSAVDTIDEDLLFVISREEYNAIADSAKHNFMLSEDGTHAYAMGKEFDPLEWIDTKNHALHKEPVRKKLKERIIERSTLAHGGRFDMAHLLTLPGFMRAWGWTGVQVDNEDGLYYFWADVSSAVHETDQSDYLMIAEAYGEEFVKLLLPWFDGVYDKEYYDLLLSATKNVSMVEQVRNKIKERLNSDHRNKFVRFIQNHDEGPAHKVFGEQASLACAALIIFQPAGILLIQDAQMFGFPYKLPVQVNAYPREEINSNIYMTLSRLLRLRKSDELFSKGEANLVETPSGIIGFNYHNTERGIVVCVNLTKEIQKGNVFLPDRTEIDSVFLPIENQYIQDFDPRLTGNKYIELSPYQVQVIRYKKKTCE